MTSHSSFLAAIFWLAAAMAGTPAASSPTTVAGTPAADPPPFALWAVSPEMRLTPASVAREVRTTASAEAFRNEFVSLQAAVRSRSRLAPFSAHCLPAENEGPAALPCAWVQIRYPGVVLVDEIGQETSDPLLEDPPAALEPNVTQGVWITVRVPKEARPGNFAARVRIRAGDYEQTLCLELRVLDFVLPDPGQGSFYLNIWQDPAAVARAAGVPLWSESHWRLLGAYARDLAAHGQQSITTSILHDPWLSQTGFEFPSMVEWRFPGEWTLGQEARFEFDYTVFDRYVQLMIDAGVGRTLHAFSLVDGPGLKAECRIGYRDTVNRALRFRDTTVGDEWYRAAWRAFLPGFVRHLKEKGWLDRTRIGFDEKPQTVMKGILEVLRSHAPELGIALAGGTYSELAGEAAELTVHWDDLARPQEIEALLARRRGRGPTLYYTACEPALPNTFLYSSLWESRLLPWVARRHGLDGYLRWAYQSWPEDVWRQPFFKWHSGDMFFVYPGPHGPLASTRWEMLRQGIQDCEAVALLDQRLRELRRAGREAEAARLGAAGEAVVAEASQASRCWGTPDLTGARQKINALLAEAAAAVPAAR